MRELDIECSEAQYSRLGFATELCNLAKKYESDILIKIMSENKVSGQVDLKSYLGVVAAMTNHSNKISLLIIGDDEDNAAFELKGKITALLKKYN